MKYPALSQTLSWSQTLADSVHLTEEEMVILHRAIFAGIIKDSIDLPSFCSLEKLGFWWWSLILETSWNLTGNPGWILESTENLPITPEEIPEEFHLPWAERTYLRATALYNSFKTSDATACWRNLAFARIDNAARLAMTLKFEYFNAIDLFNRGYLESSLDIVNHVRNQGLMDVVMHLRCCRVAALAHILMAKPAEAKKELDIESQIVFDLLPCPAQFATTLRSRIFLAMALEKFQEAEEALQRAFSLGIHSIMAYCALIEAKIRLLLTRQKIDALNTAIAEAEAHAHEYKIPFRYVDMPKIKAELLLREEKANEAIAIVTPALAEALQNNDLQEECELRSYLALAKAIKGDISGAIDAIKAAFALAENHTFVYTKLDIMFKATGIFMRANDTVSARTWCSQAGSLVKELGLPHRLACFHYAHAALNETSINAVPFLALLEHRQLGRELEGYLISFGLLKKISLEFKNGDINRVIKEQDAREYITQNAGFFCFEIEGILVYSDGKGVVSTKKLPLEKGLFLRFYSCEKLTTADIHKMRSGQIYDTLRHSVACKNTVMRLRNEIKDLPISLEFTQGHYTLTSLLPRFYVLSNGLPSTTITQDNRIEQIIQLIRINGKKSTQELCKEFGVSRQALHPVLKMLVEQKRIRLIKKGPASYYVAGTL